MSLGVTIISFTILSGIFIVPLFVLWIISFVRAGRKNDPARVGFAWLKAVFPSWLILLSLRVIQGCLQVLDLYGDLYGTLASRQVSRALEHAIPTGDFFHSLSNILLFVTLVEIAGGYVICANGPSAPNSGPKFARGAVLTWGFILFALAIAQFGFDQSLVTRTFEDDDFGYYYEGVRLKIKVYRFAGALTILFWLTTLPILGYGAAAVHKTTARLELRSGAILLLVCTILDFIRHLVNMATFIDYWLIDLVDKLYFGNNRDISIWYIVKPVFDYILMFIILTMLFSLGIRKHKGLWLYAPPEWNYPPVMVVPTAYPVTPVQGASAHPQPVQQSQSIPSQYPAPQGYYYQPQPPQQQEQYQQQQGPSELDPKWCQSQEPSELDPMGSQPQGPSELDTKGPEPQVQQARQLQR